MWSSDCQPNSGLLIVGLLAIVRFRLGNLAPGDRHAADGAALRREPTERPETEAVYATSRHARCAAGSDPPLRRTNQRTPPPYSRGARAARRRMSIGRATWDRAGEAVRRVDVAKQPWASSRHARAAVLSSSQTGAACNARPRRQVRNPTVVLQRPRDRDPSPPCRRPRAARTRGSKTKAGSPAKAPPRCSQTSMWSRRRRLLHLARRVGAAFRCRSSPNSCGVRRRCSGRTVKSSLRRGRVFLSALCRLQRTSPIA